VSALDKNLCAFVAILNLHKAFDSLDHQLLLNECGISGTEICWFMSCYLQDLLVYELLN